jgi:hypothetical protein
MSTKLLEQFFLWVHGLSGAAWFGAIFYRTLVVDSKAFTYFDKRSEYEHFSTHLAHNMRYFVTAGLLTCGLSGFALLGLKWDGASGAWLALMSTKTGVWLAACGLFTYVSWVHWPWRALAAPEEFAAYRRQGQRLAVGMVVLAGTGFALGQASRVLSGIAPVRTFVEPEPPNPDIRSRPALSGSLISLGWFLFGISLLCPALSEGAEMLPGWKCFLASLCFCPMWLVWPVAVFGITNLLFLFGALVYAWGGGLERKVYGVFLFLAASVTLVLMVVVFFNEARAGAYLWLGSLFVTAGGFFLADRPQSPT